MQVTVKPGSDDSAEQEHLVQRNLIVQLDKGAAGTRQVELSRESVQGRTYGEVAHMAVERLGTDPWAADFESLLQDRHASLERVTSGTQSHYVARDAPFDGDVAQRESVRFSVARDHTGGFAA